MRPEAVNSEEKSQDLQGQGDFREVPCALAPSTNTRQTERKLIKEMSWEKQVDVLGSALAVSKCMAAGITGWDIP